MFNWLTSAFRPRTETIWVAVPNGRHAPPQITTDPLALPDMTHDVRAVSAQTGMGFRIVECRVVKEVATIARGQITSHIGSTPRPSRMRRLLAYQRP